ncbi:MAG: 2-oxoglutarate dehydrogenase E1 component, partial [Flavobacteriales bacterium]
QVDKNTIEKIGNKITELPKNKKLFRKMEKLLFHREHMIKEDKLDWGLCELLAYGSLLLEGHPVRLTGQDSERGTFAHRHAVVKIEDSGEEYVHLSKLDKDQAPFYIYNSPLSEYGVMGFDYGYSLMSSNTLTIWEAQFGDFCNGAQVVIDQYISSAEDKWKSTSGLVLLLPHGYEGMGAEHSSARMERFLNLAAEENLQLVNCTTPANFFHVLRRQLKWEFRKPLVIFTPKSLLRHPRCISSMKELTGNKFQEVIDDPRSTASKVNTIAFCQGKIYYELLEKKEELEVENIALVRIEQLYPLPNNKLKKIIEKYKAENHLWVQEEPKNMGAWPFLLREFDEVKLTRISRDASASPASGSPKKFQDRQNYIINKVFDDYGIKPKKKASQKKKVKKTA